MSFLFISLQSGHVEKNIYQTKKFLPGVSNKSSIASVINAYSCNDVGTDRH